MTASPLGFGSAAMRPEDIARLFGRQSVAQAGSEAPTLPAPVLGLGFGAAPMPSSVAPGDLGPGRMPGSVPVAMDEAETQRLERATGMVPAAAPGSSARPVPGLARVPLPPTRPPEISAASQADMPAEGAQPIMAQPQASPRADLAASPAREEPGVLDKIMGGIQKSDGLLTSIGMGLMTTPGFGPAVGVGLAHHQQAQKARVATDLAQAELALKQRKLAQETGALQGNAAIVKRAFPDLSDAEALSAGSNSSLVTEALKIVRDPNHGRDSDPSVIRARAQAQAEGTAAGQPQDVYRQEQDDAGNVWSVNGRTGHRTVALQAKDDKPQLGEIGVGDGTMRTKALIGRDGAVNPVGVPYSPRDGTTINNMGAEKAQDATVGKGYGEYQLDLATKGRNARTTLNTLALMEQAMKQPGFYSGVGAERFKQANQLLGSLGVKDSRAASAAEVFDALSNKVVLDGLGGSLGAGVSNPDRDFIKMTAPSLLQSEEGNRNLIGIARSLAQRQADVAKFASDYANARGGRIDGGFDQALEVWATANPLFPSARQDVSASAPKEPPQGAPQDARQARDGKWYAPDPNRPGKYLEVR